jgi:hypothetical protein
MAINLKPVDVAEAGLGAGCGVAVLPPERAGLRVAGIEAGTWMDPVKDFKPDELHNNVRSLVTIVVRTVRTSPGRWASPHETQDVAMLTRGMPCRPVLGASGASNPTLTMQAPAWRTAGHLTKNWKSIGGS